MFELDATYTYPWPVTVHAPSRTTAGTFDIVDRFTVTFRFIPDDEAGRLDAAFDALPAAEKPARRYYAMEAAVTGWDKAVPFTAAALRTALRDPYYGPALLAAWQASLSPLTGQRVGN